MEDYPGEVTSEAEELLVAMEDEVHTDMLHIRFVLVLTIQHNRADLGTLWTDSYIVD